ncbi:MAG: D-glycerate dehydrogenase, partial [Candidatus Uhrbacteria bacterium]
MATIYVTRNIPNEGLKLLERAGHTVIVSPHPRVLTKDELIATLHEHRPDALLCLLTDTIDGDVMDAAAPSLKVIANFAVGFNNIDVAAAKTRGLMVTNTPGVLDSAVAEHTVALILALMRRIV